MRALWSQAKNPRFFTDRCGPFQKWTFINVQNRFVKIKPRKIHGFLDSWILGFLDSWNIMKNNYNLLIITINI